MAEPTRANLQSHFPITEITNDQIDYALTKAIAEVKARVGTSAYSDAIAESPTDTTAAAFITEAVELFAIARLMRNTGLRFRRNGFVVKETDASSPAMTAGSQIQNEYLTPKEQREHAENFRTQAFETLELAGIDNGKTLYEFAFVGNTETVASIRKQTSSEWND